MDNETSNTSHEHNPNAQREHNAQPSNQAGSTEPIKLPLNGKFLMNSVSRTLTGYDPATKRPIKQNIRLSQVNGLAVTRIAGKGKSARTGDEQVTLEGQYAPFKRQRVTIAGDENLNTLRKYFADKKLTSDPKSGQIISTDTGKPAYVVFMAIGNPMTASGRGQGERVQTYGMEVVELYEEVGPQEFNPIIVPPSDEQAQSGSTDVGSLRL